MNTIAIDPIFSFFNKYNATKNAIISYAPQVISLPEDTAAASIKPRVIGLSTVSKFSTFLLFLNLSNKWEIIVSPIYLILLGGVYSLCLK